MKRRLVHLLAVVCYFCGLDALFYALNRRAKRIVTFHNVLRDELFRPGLANGVSNRLSEFVHIVDECAKRFPISNDLFDPTTLTITFDDGYRNQYTTAFKHLRGKGFPAILFLAGDLAPNEGNGEEGAEEGVRGEDVPTAKTSGLVVDRLLHQVAEAPIEMIPGGDRLSYWMKTVWPKFVREARRRGAASAFDGGSFCPDLPVDYLQERLGTISAAELNEMRTAGWQIGWHTKSHVPLAALDEASVRAELDSPSVYRAVCLSYPFGNPEEVGDLAPRLAAELGYPCAVSNTNTAPANAASRYFLPRLALPADAYELHFELSGLKFFLKNRRLLPVARLTRG